MIWNGAKSVFDMGCVGANAHGAVYVNIRAVYLLFPSIRTYCDCMSSFGYMGTLWRFIAHCLNTMNTRQAAVSSITNLPECMQVAEWNIHLVNMNGAIPPLSNKDYIETSEGEGA